MDPCQSVTNHSMRSSRVEWRPFGGGAGGANDISPLLFFLGSSPAAIRWSTFQSCALRSFPIEFPSRFASNVRIPRAKNVSLWQIPFQTFLAACEYVRVLIASVRMNWTASTCAPSIARRVIFVHLRLNDCLDRVGPKRTWIEELNGCRMVFVSVKSAHKQARYLYSGDAHWPKEGDDMEIISHRSIGRLSTHFTKWLNHGYCPEGEASRIHLQIKENQTLPPLAEWKGAVLSESIGLYLLWWSSRGIVNLAITPADREFFKKSNSWNKDQRDAAVWVVHEKIV